MGPVLISNSTMDTIIFAPGWFVIFNMIQSDAMVLPFSDGLLNKIFIIVLIVIFLEFFPALNKISSQNAAQTSFEENNSIQFLSFVDICGWYKVQGFGVLVYFSCGYRLVHNVNS